MFYLVIYLLTYLLTSAELWTYIARRHLRARRHLLIGRLGAAASTTTACGGCSGGTARKKGPAISHVLFLPFLRCTINGAGYAM